MLLADKPRVASLLPSSAVIEAPDTDTLNASLPIHPGASAYLSGNQPSVTEEAQNILYWVGIIASILASTAAATAALFRRFAPKRPEATLKLLDLWVAARAASKNELAEIDAKVDAIVQEMVKKQIIGKGEEVSAALPLIVNEVKRASTGESMNWPNRRFRENRLQWKLWPTRRRRCAMAPPLTVLRAPIRIVSG